MKNPTPVAVTSRSFSRHDILREELLERYPHVTFNSSAMPLSGEDLINFLRGHTKAITALEKLNEEIFAALPELKVVSKYGVGLDMIDLVAMECRGILLGWTGGVNRRSVAELVISSVIALLHQAPLASIEVKSGKWRQIRGLQVTGRTVGIIGSGHIGKEVASLFRAFDCVVLAHDILDFPEFYEAHGIIPVSLEEALRRSDVVTLHLPLDDSTRNILNLSRLEMMKPGAFLVNMARGGLIDETVLKEMLKNGRIGGAALDVFAEEPPSDHDLLNLPNVIPTPHIGGSTEEAVLAMGRAAIEGLDNAVLPSLLPIPGADRRSGTRTY
jgi:phosphoglycerate dehydrogenase-like enzyme